MSHSSSFQSLLAYSATNAPFFELLCLNPRRAGEFFQLTETQQEHLLELDKEEFKLYSNALKDKREKYLLEAYDVLCLHFQEELVSALQQYLFLTPLNSQDTPNTDIVRCGFFLEEYFFQNSKVPVYFSEIIRFERLLFQQSKISEPLKYRKKTLDGNYLINPDIQIETFNYPVHHIQLELYSTELKNDLSPYKVENSIIIFSTLYMVKDYQSPQSLLINQAVLDLLKLLNGENDLNTAYKALRETYPHLDYEEHFLNMINSYIKLGILEN